MSCDRQTNWLILPSSSLIYSCILTWTFSGINNRNILLLFASGFSYFTFTKVCNTIRSTKYGVGAVTKFTRATKQVKHVSYTSPGSNRISFGISFLYCIPEVGLNATQGQIFIEQRSFNHTSEMSSLDRLYVLCFVGTGMTESMSRKLLLPSTVAVLNRLANIFKYLKQSSHKEKNTEFQHRW